MHPTLKMFVRSWGNTEKALKPLNILQHTSKHSLGAQLLESSDSPVAPPRAEVGSRAAPGEGEASWMALDQAERSLLGEIQSLDEEVQRIDVSHSAFGPTPATHALLT